MSPPPSAFAAPLHIGGDPPRPVSPYQYFESPEDRLQRLEVRWQSVRQQIKEMEVEMEHVRMTPHNQGGHTHPAYRLHGYAPDISKYDSLPHLDRFNNSSNPNQIVQDQSASYFPPVKAPLPQYQVTTAVTSVRAAPATTQTEPVDQSSAPIPQDEEDDAESIQSAPVSQTGLADSVAVTAQTVQVSLAPTVPPVPTVKAQSASSASPVLPEVSGVPATPIQNAPHLGQPVYNVTRDRQPPPHQSYFYPPVQHLAPPVQPYYPQQFAAPGQPLDNSNAPGVLEMVIASSFGIPKPKLTAFSSGKESDFSLLKKGLDSVLEPHRHLSEDYKYEVLLDHLRFPAALQIAKWFLNSTRPYTTAMQAFMQRYGQPRQLVQGEFNAILSAPPVKASDYQGIEDFAASLGILVGMLSTMQGPSMTELQCGSHVDTLLTKLPVNFRDAFTEYCLTRGIIQSGSDRTYTLPDLAEWLERKVQTLQIFRRISTCPLDATHADSRERRTTKQSRMKSATIFLSNHHGAQQPNVSPASSTSSQLKKHDRFKPYCPYCNNQEHYLSACDNFAKLTNNLKVDWIKETKRCWRCGRGHTPDNCTLK